MAEYSQSQAAQLARVEPESPITIVPANEASCEDLRAVFGTRGEASGCQCQRFKTPARTWDREQATGSVEARADRLRDQTRCGQPEASTTSGLVAYLDGEPVGWCAVEPRTAYVRLQRKPLVWAGRAEDKADASVWAVVCLITRAGFRRRGVTYALAPPSTSLGNAAPVRSRATR
jgi:hypothetical protein